MERQFIDSGSKGIGLIPNTWESQPLVLFFSENRKANTDLESVSALQFKYGEIIQKPNNGRDLNDKDRELLSKYTIVEPGDVVVNGLNLNFDLKSLRIAIAREKGVITSAYIVLRPRKGVNSEYFNYVLKALDFQKILHGMGEGIRLTLSFDELKKIIVPTPKQSLQSAIVNYLDEKCGEIDSLIALQEQMIEKLKAYKQSVITEAVTKGLNPNAKLVPSGIDWIGDIPEGWKVLPIKRICRKITDGSHFSPNTTSEGKPYITVSNVYDDIVHVEEAAKITPEDFDILVTNGCQPPCGSVLLAKDGTVGRTAVVIENDFVVLSSLGILTPNDSVYSKYLKYLLDSDSLQAQMLLAMAGSALRRITITKICKLVGLLPPLSEQKAIVSFLDGKCTEIDNLIKLKLQKIEKLKDYKKSVIYEAVTGKIVIE